VRLRRLPSNAAQRGHQVTILTSRTDHLTGEPTYTCYYYQQRTPDIPEAKVSASAGKPFPEHGVRIAHVSISPSICHHFCTDNVFPNTLDHVRTLWYASHIC